MSKTPLSIDQLREAVENLSPEEFHLLNQTLDLRRQSRLKEIAEKARRKAAGSNADDADHIVRKAIMKVRAENAAHGRLRLLTRRHLSVF